MKKPDTPRADALRAMREKQHEQWEARQKAERAASRAAGKPVGAGPASDAPGAKAKPRARKRA